MKTKQKILITGAKGMLGRTLVETLADDYEVIATGRESADITNYDGFLAAISKFRPDVIIHCAAMTDVDGCEIEPEKAYFINTDGTKNVALAANKCDCRLIYISTDYVFDGDKDCPYVESDKAGTAHTVYGRTKWRGELAVSKFCPNSVIARVSWLYGPKGPSFVNTMLKLADGNHPVIKVVNDQRGNPTSTYAVANEIKEILEHPELTGIFHVSCEGIVSWFGFAKKIFELKEIKQNIEACSSDEYPRAAKRPKNSALNKIKLKKVGLSQMPDWEDCLKEFLTSRQNI